MAADTLKYVFLEGNGTFLFEFQPMYRKQTISFCIINNIIHVGRNDNTTVLVQLSNVLAPKKRRGILDTTGLLYHSCCVYMNSITQLESLFCKPHSQTGAMYRLYILLYVTVNEVLGSSWKTIVIVLRQDSIII